MIAVVVQAVKHEIYCESGEGKLCETRSVSDRDKFIVELFGT